MKKIYLEIPPMSLVSLRQDLLSKATHILNTHPSNNTAKAKDFTANDVVKQAKILEEYVTRIK